MIKFKYQELSCLNETHFINNKEYLDQKKRIYWSKDYLDEKKNHSL